MQEFIVAEFDRRQQPGNEPGMVGIPPLDNAQLGEWLSATWILHSKMDRKTPLGEFLEQLLAQIVCAASVRLESLNAKENANDTTNLHGL